MRMARRCALHLESTVWAVRTRGIHSAAGGASDSARLARGRRQTWGLRGAKGIKGAIGKLQARLWPAAAQGDSKGAKECLIQSESGMWSCCWGHRDSEGIAIAHAENKRVDRIIGLRPNGASSQPPPSRASRSSLFSNHALFLYTTPFLLARFDSLLISHAPWDVLDRPLSSVQFRRRRVRWRYPKHKTKDMKGFRNVSTSGGRPRGVVSSDSSWCQRWSEWIFTALGAALCVISSTAFRVSPPSVILIILGCKRASPVGSCDYVDFATPPTLPRPARRPRRPREPRPPPSDLVHTFYCARGLARAPSSSCTGVIAPTTQPGDASRTTLGAAPCTLSLPRHRLQSTALLLGASWICAGLHTPTCTVYNEAPRGCPATIDLCRWAAAEQSAQASSSTLVSGVNGLILLLGETSTGERGNLDAAHVHVSPIALRVEDFWLSTSVAHYENLLVSGAGHGARIFTAMLRLTASMLPLRRVADVHAPKGFRTDYSRPMESSALSARKPGQGPIFKMRTWGVNYFHMYQRLFSAAASNATIQRLRATFIVMDLTLSIIGLVNLLIHLRVELGWSRAEAPDATGPPITSSASMFAVNFPTENDENSVSETGPKGKSGP
ncbi:hypothetical protein FB451DRAFT_1165044 [Mycena latifolia]|nr:hypothetical protein FB451DRAFT_1165044 [Mycena latifolia]